ncbi:hypothetical protein KVR01_009581 [Diaporthe batatas]|uniref:uncharacterized protein n=1 Tax=Diaporthe batatas TaxID=748121 RepID=UPI001D044393|nr:uncharacterized protein KVR01_009581 [Diaporthe batatas]KAG8161317.1 hypothetical protein KVR01_009581 [Diaporthe batatas]
MTKILALLVLQITASLAADDCAPKPISVDVKDVTLSNNKTARGVALSVGSPKQNFAFMPMWPMNNTMMYGTDGYCTLRGADAWTDEACVTFRGGAYDNTTSNTEGPAAAGSYPEDQLNLTWPWYPETDHFTDRLSLDENTTLLDFPLTQAKSDWNEEAYHALMVIGLGGNSSILNVLKNSDKILTRTYSFFYGFLGGRTSTRANGQMVFGGYDASKVSGQGSEHSLATAETKCPSKLVVIVTGMALRFANGTETNIFGTSDSSALAVCIDPNLPTAMRMPFNPYFNNWMTATDNSIFSMNRSLGLFYYNMRYPANTPAYDGDLLITLDTGLTVTLTNDNLVQPHTYIDQDTGDLIVDDDMSEPDLLIDSEQDINENDMATFGSLFFQAAYMAVNLDTGKFTLWAANTNSSSTADFRALDADHEEVTSWCEAGDKDVQSNSTASDPTTSSVSSATAAADDSGGGLSTGATVGIAIGVAIGAFAIIGGLVLWIRSRKRRSEYMAAELGDSSGSGSNRDLTTGADRHQPDQNGGPQSSFEAYELHDSTRPELHPESVQKFELHDARSGRPELHPESVQKFELHDARSGRPELHEDSVQKFEMPESGPPTRYELSS